ncbi:hypothetical protein ACQP1G_11310 [Nocardia sp. CA-107356]|uniref:hypothetical protein n=1 Tax=Nocardia sp. CA-107356 TaxID=3239972 RepID=UPI003D92F45C
MSTRDPDAGGDAGQRESGGTDPGAGASGDDGSSSPAPESAPGGEPAASNEHPAASSPGRPEQGAGAAPPEPGHPGYPGFGSPGGESAGDESAGNRSAEGESVAPQPISPGEEPRRFGIPPRAGSMQRQEPGVTQPRPPTVAEARARDKARKRAEEAQRAAAAAAENKKRTRKRVLIGGVAIVGVAGLVGGGYLAYKALTKPDNVTAYCTVIDQNGQEVVVDDDRCETASNAVGSGTGGAHTLSNGIFIYNGSQYRYYYGGNNTVGRPPTGGTTVQPKGAQISTKSGGTVTRGGLGTSSKSGSGS